MADQVVWCRDRRGRHVHLPPENWFGKIILDHAEMSDNEASVVQTIEDPDVHVADRVHGDREVYYRWGVLPHPDEDRYVKVVVAYRSDHDGAVTGRVVTAFAVDALTRGETRIWTRAGFTP